ncbi:MAG: helix-turn-helix domain-containing protein [Chitinophagaceae bacterium]|jgi:excisionase family DNA binding protein|nr:helix-turn-helix domain-containing protein [Chitinophagaceae bacterium]
MKGYVNNTASPTPMLFPFEPEQFWLFMRQVIREEITNVQKIKPVNSGYDTPGMIYKPLFKITEVCQLFQVSKPTIYDWIRHGKLKPYKIRSRVYFLWQDIQHLLHPASGDSNTSI